MRWVACLGVYEKVMFKAMIHRTIGYTFNHKKTRAIIEGELIKFMEDPKNKEMIKDVVERCIIEYAKQTGYKL